MLGGVSESKLIPGLTHGPEPHSHCGQTGHQAFETVGEKGPILAFEKGCVGDKDSIRRRLDGTEEHAALECVVPLRAYLWIARSIHRRPWDPFLRERTARTRTGTVFSCNPSCLVLLPRRVCWPSFDQSAHIAHLHLHCDVLWRHGSRRAFGLRRFRHYVGDLVCYHVEESNWARCHETRETSQIGPCGGVCHAGRQGNERNKTVNSSPPGRVWSCLS